MSTKDKKGKGKSVVAAVPAIADGDAIEGKSQKFSRHAQQRAAKRAHKAAEAAKASSSSIGKKLNGKSAGSKGKKRARDPDDEGDVDEDGDMEEDEGLAAARA